MKQMRQMRYGFAIFLTALAATAFAQTPSILGDGRAEPDARYVEDEAPWQELKEVEPPAFPSQENLIEFYVSPVATNKYFIDASTLSVGSDGIVRYVLVVLTAGGATNVSFEGINCKELAWKHYATGRGDRSWVKSRAVSTAWRPIENKPVNRHHAALSRDLFCPSRSAIGTADEGRNALRLGKHPDAN